MNHKQRMRWSFAPALVLVLAVFSVSVAGPVNVPNTFVPGDVADANQVNANFAAVEAAVNDNDTRISANTQALVNGPRVWAEQDANSGGVNVIDAASKEINSLSINAPSNGVLVISGGVFINNQEAGQQIFRLIPTLDGVDVMPGGWVPYLEAGAVGEPADPLYLQYTVVSPVTAGPHTVAQTLDMNGNADADFFHNKERLIVMFFPNGSITNTNTPALFAPGSGGSDDGE
ncbi:MAG: hypothetical protein QNJ98_00510 [Planctomycetota bacterium]|nr:hypothetical protein [Planctomycetota bacterium]